MKTVTPDSPLVEVIQKMNKFEIGSVVVVQRRRAVGIITERDIMRKIIEPWIDPAIIKAREIMSTPPITIRDDAPLEEAAEIMMKNRIKKLPVVKNEKVMGIVTATDLARSAPQLINLLNDLMWRVQRIS
ncbi:CBS domain-containing protein [Candidatus Bathyarchaeota archaeon]|nr:CBS domain-containing protein [Candidatus Bathyarchaeota archaeon]